MDGNIVLKALAIMALIAAFWLNFRKKKLKNIADTPIEEADARERQAWRYPVWGIKTLQLVASAFLIWMLIKS